MAWYWWLFFIGLYSLMIFGLGVLYKARKFKPIVAVLKDSSLTAEEKISKVVSLLF